MPQLGDDGGRREMEKKARAEGRLPPGQSLTIKWPVLHAGGVPRFRSCKMGFPHRWTRRRAAAIYLAGISRSSANRSNL